MARRGVAVRSGSALLLPILLVLSPAQAAVVKIAPLKIQPMALPVAIALQDSARDEVSGVVASAGLAIYFGNEGTGGFVAGAKDGQEIWRTVLPDNSWPAAGAPDGQGGIWLAGMAATPGATVSPSPWPTGVINIGNVPNPSPSVVGGGLTTLALWHLDQAGHLLSTATLLLPAPAIPAIKSVTATGLVISGPIATNTFDQFRTTVSFAGVFTQPVISQSSAALAPTSYLYKLGNISWKLAYESGSLAEVPTLRLAKPSWVALKYSGKKVVAIFRLANSFIAADANTRTGLVILSAAKRYYLNQLS